MREITMQDRIEKVVDMNAPVARVWKALTDHRDFGEWFRANLDGPFEVGKTVRGKITYPGHEGMKFEATVEAMEPEKRFAYRWCPYGGDPEVDYSNDPTTLVEFRLEPTAKGTRLFITESGFAAVDEKRRAESFRRNSRGWEIQVENIKAHVGG